MNTESANTDGWIIHADSSTFDDLLQSDVPLLVDFWAGWCAPCRALMPVLENVINGLAGQILLVKVNADEQPELSARYGIRSLPTVLLIRNGEIVDRFQGALPESQVLAFLEPYVEHEYDRLLAEGQAELTAGQLQNGLAKLRQAAEQAPQQVKVVAALVNALLEQSHKLPELADSLLGEAQQVIDHAGFALQRDPLLTQARSRLNLLRSGQSGDDLQTLRDAAGLGDGGAAVRLSAMLAAAGNYGEALELLLGLLQPGRLTGESKDQVRTTLIDLLNTLPDREMANQYRRKMFALLH